VFRGRVNIVAVPAGRWTRIKQAASWRQLMKKEKRMKIFRCPFHFRIFRGRRLLINIRTKQRSRAKGRVWFEFIIQPGLAIWLIITTRPWSNPTLSPAHPTLLFGQFSHLDTQHGH